MGLWVFADVLSTVQHREMGPHCRLTNDVVCNAVLPVGLREWQLQLQQTFKALPHGVGPARARGLHTDQLRGPCCMLCGSCTLLACSCLFVCTFMRHPAVWSAQHAIGTQDGHYTDVPSSAVCAKVCLLSVTVSRDLVPAITHGW